MGAPASAINFKEALRATLQKSELLAQRQEGVNQAEEQIDQARGAILPNISANATHFRQDQPTDPFARSFSPASQDSARLTVEQPIFRGLGEFAAYRQRRRNLESQEFNKENTRVTLYQDIASNYYNILYLEQDIRNLKEQLELFNQRVNDFQVRSQRGESNVTELLAAQSTRASLEATVQLVSGQLASAREMFSFLTGFANDTVLEDETRREDKKTLHVKGIEDYTARVEERPDILSAIQKVKMAEEEIRIARSGHWPSVDAVGNYHLKRPVAFLEDIRWDVELRLRLPLFEGGARQAKVREAASKKRVEDLELARLRRLAIQQIRSLHESLKVRMNQVAALEKTMALAEKNYKTFQREFRNRLVNSITSQVAMTEYLNARRTYDQARYAAQIDLINLEAASYIVPTEVKE